MVLDSLLALPRRCLFVSGCRGVRLVVGAVGSLPTVLDSNSLGLAFGGVVVVDAEEGSESHNGSDESQV